VPLPALNSIPTRTTPVIPRRVRSWRHPRCDRLRANGYVCASRAPFQNPSRDLFAPRRFLVTPESAAFNGIVQWHSVTTVTSIGCLAAPLRYPAQGPLSGAAKHSAGARPSKCIIITPVHYLPNPGAKVGLPRRTGNSLSESSDQRTCLPISVETSDESSSVASEST
jgi:hypothetical protein